MYKPANIREFVTPATLYRTVMQTINGRQQKTEVQVASLRGKFNGKFKQKGSHELNANSLVVVSNEITYTTWWREGFKAGDRLVIDGMTFEIYGQPENVEMRGRYAVLHLKRLEGGA